MRLVPAVAALVLFLGAVPARASDLEDGKKLLKDGRPAEAAVALQKALKLAPTNREVVLLLAKAAAEGRVQDASEEAETALHAALKQAPGDRTLRLALGNLYLARVHGDPKWGADVQEQFGRLLREDPADEEATVGLARLYYENADPKHGLEKVDELLAKKPTSAPALYWRGKILFDDGTQKFKAAQLTMTPEAKASFEGALAAFSSSTKADPSNYDAWIQLGYAAQYLAVVDRANVEVASAAYMHALDANGDDDAAMRGLSKLYNPEPARWVEVLDKLAKERPKTPIVLYYQAYSLRQKGKKDEAEKTYKAFVAASRHPAAGLFALAEMAQERGDEKEALALYRKSLEADPRHAGKLKALEALQGAIGPRLRDAVGDAAKARAVVKDFESLMPLAPWSASLRQDAAFFAREAYGNTKDRTLDAAVKHYVEAAALIDPYQSDFEQSVPYRDRHEFAQIHNDTGLMFQYYPETLDLAKAEAHYKEAMAWTQNGYWDAYGNLLKMYEAAGRIKDARDLALDCADGLKNPDGSANDTWRATARGDAARLEAKLPK